MSSQAQVAPALTGYVDFPEVYGSIPSFTNTSGVFSKASSSTTYNQLATQSSEYAMERLSFTASRSNSVYTGSLLRPLSRTCLFYIKY